LRENLLLARPGLTMEEVEERAKELGLHEDILSLPQGYETPLGDRGFLLSGGQRQRLALLRALLEGSPVFLLDEPTASLEPLAARDLFYRFLDLVEGKSLILITHRPLGLDLG
ncbi:MAG TPA: ATP-binding cassette domain-containing protein, partial [Moorella mulderi]|nr:ATP-binding cassette domain-containing protein [Moorella mulderi]